ncbi:MAG: circadian clock protein KaiC [Isosphaeraceae bacterium]
MRTIDHPFSVPKVRTKIDGFDLIANGGLPLGRVTLISGTSGSAKTVFAAQFLAAGLSRAGENGVFVTFEESPADMRRNMKGFGWDIETWEAESRWAFVDASPQPGEPLYISGRYDLGALLARIEHAVKRVQAKRISVDSLGGIFAQFSDEVTIRQELFRLTLALKAMGLTSIITAERTDDYGSIARFGVEEFVSDNVIVLRNALEDEVRRRTVEILKFRGTGHQKGEWPFTIVPDEGIIVISLSAVELKQKSSAARITSGNAELDKMCGGGFFRDSVILVSGPTGTGKTLITTEYLAAGVNAGNRCLLFAFDESRESPGQAAGPRCPRGPARPLRDDEGLRTAGALTALNCLPKSARSPGLAVGGAYRVVGGNPGSGIARAGKSSRPGPPRHHGHIDNPDHSRCPSSLG